MFTVAGEHLTLRMRKLAFASMLKQEMAWFDNPKNNTGALCSRLSADAAAIQGVSLFKEVLQKLVLGLFNSTLLFRIQFISKTPKSLKRSALRILQTRTSLNFTGYSF